MIRRRSADRASKTAPSLVIVDFIWSHKATSRHWGGPVKRLIAIIATLLGMNCAHAVSDIGLASMSPYAVRMLPAGSGSVSFAVTNHGPDAVAPTIATNSIYLLLSGYTLTMAEPACGVLTSGSDLQSVALGTLDAGASVTCTLNITRDTSPYAASDLPLYWFAQVAGDSNPTNDTVGFAIGSLIDVSVAIVPVAFTVDGDGIAHGIDRLIVVDHGPSDVMDFVVGACTDHGPPAFLIDAGFDGGCGSAQYSPGCFDSGFGFVIPTMAPGDVYSCTIALTGTAPYDNPVTWSIGTDLLPNPDTLGGSLLDTAQADNHADLVLGPASDDVFASAFDG
jgi:hypothetical protein